MKKIGIVGQGNISPAYLSTIGKVFQNIQIAGTCDLVREKAEAQAAAYGVPKIYNDMYELFADPEVDIVLNITRPNDHYGVTKAALLAGKSVYSEKPLATNIEDAKELVALALEKGLWLGGAPDTFMGAGIQTSRKLIDDGVIGKPIAAQAHFLGHGPESWHPDPYFFFEKGGGPMLDMGPYYITTLVNVFGQATDVTAFGSISFPERVIGSEPHKGDTIHVEVDTFTTGAIRFASGAVASFTASFDVYTDEFCMLTIYGTEGTMKIPDPNCFGGVVKVYKEGQGWKDYPVTFPYDGPSRGLGLADMAKCMEEGGMHRANYQQQLHVLDIMTAFARSNKANAPIHLETPYERQRPMWQEKEF